MSIRLPFTKSTRYFALLIWRARTGTSRYQWIIGTKKAKGFSELSKSTVMDVPRRTMEYICCGSRVTVNRGLRNDRKKMQRRIIIRWLISSPFRRKSFLDMNCKFHSHLGNVTVNESVEFNDIDRTINNLNCFRNSIIDLFDSLSNTRNTFLIKLIVSPAETFPTRKFHSAENHLKG